MFEIIALQATSHGYRARSTDYPLLPLAEALALITALTTEAIAADHDQRWTLIPASYHGRPFDPQARSHD